jgi:hypothetical protein
MLAQPPEQAPVGLPADVVMEDNIGHLTHPVRTFYPLSLIIVAELLDYTKESYLTNSTLDAI